MKQIDNVMRLGTSYAPDMAIRSCAWSGGTDASASKYRTCTGNASFSLYFSCQAHVLDPPPYCQTGSNNLVGKKEHEVNALRDGGDQTVIRWTQIYRWRLMHGQPQTRLWSRMMSHDRGYP